MLQGEGAGCRGWEVRWLEAVQVSPVGRKRVQKGWSTCTFLLMGCYGEGGEKSDIQEENIGQEDIDPGYWGMG